MVSPAMMLRRLLPAVMVIVGAMAFGNQAQADCRDLLPQNLVRQPGSRAITANDLVSLREIGMPYAQILGPSPLTLSPDGKELAFILLQGDAGQNKICRGVVVVRLADGHARLIDTGGEPIFSSNALRGLETIAGADNLIRPVWAPDGTSIAYRRRDNGVTQAWIAKVDGSGARPITHGQADVMNLAWSGDGRRLIISTHPEQARLKKAYDREARSGWLYDRRIIPNMTLRPQMPAPLPEEIASIDPSDGAVRPASEAEVKSLRAWLAAGNELSPGAQASDGSRAWTAPVSAAFLAASGLKVIDARQRPVSCHWEMCEGGIVGIWWGQGEDKLLVMRREGWKNDRTALYRWKPGRGEPRRVFVTDDVLTGCIQGAAGLICDSETSRVPRHIVRLDTETGAQRAVFEPNPEFAKVKLGSVQRLMLTNKFGLRGWGDLVLPPDYRPGQRLPLIVVQYNSLGFLRGGTGNEYPIFLYAQHGFAVLSLERPPIYALSLPGMTTPDKVIAADQKDWAERRSILSSIQAGVEKVVAMGIADPAHMGITGLSDGATSARFALINYPVFAAAAISSCCLEPRTSMIYGGIAWADWQHDALGIPRAGANSDDYWRPASIVLNASKINTPLLMQLADDEFQLSLEAFTALREAGKPVEMYIFPDETHAKWQPAHRLSTYNRSLDWFAFWLQGHEDSDPAKAAQYERWRDMKGAQLTGAASDNLSSTSEPRPRRQPDP